MSITTRALVLFVAAFLITLGCRLATNAPEDATEADAPHTDHEHTGDMSAMESPEQPDAEMSAHAGHEEHGDTTPSMADHDTASAQIPTVADDHAGSVDVENELCPVMGGPIVPGNGFVYNGWWIRICCMPCRETFLANPEQYIPGLMEQTGIDVSVAPPTAPTDADASDMHDGHMEHDHGDMPGPDSSDGHGEATPSDDGMLVDVGNELCPVMGGPIIPGNGFSYNGWWIHICCMPCRETFRGNPADYIPGLIEQTGIDVRVAPTAAQRAELGTIATEDE